MSPGSHSAVLVASVVALGLLLPALAFAQTPSVGEASKLAQAAQQFAVGSRAFDRGDFARAAEAFELAYGVVPHVDSLWNAARAWQQANELPRAATLYTRYLLEAQAGARDRDVAAAQLRSLAKRLGCIEVHGSGIEQLAVDGRPSEERITYVNPGAHVVRAVVGGVLMQQTPQVAAGDVVSLVFEPPPATPSVPPPAPPPDRPAVEAPSAPPSGRHGMSPWFGVGGAVLTAAAAAFTVASGISTMSALDAFNARPTASNLATGESLQARTNVLLGISIGLGVMTTATVLWLVDWGDGRRSRGRLGVGGRGVEAGWTF